MKRIIALTAVVTASVVGFAGAAHATPVTATTPPSCPAGSVGNLVVEQTDGSYVYTQASGNPLVTFTIERVTFDGTFFFDRLHVKSKGNHDEIVDIWVETPAGAFWSEFGYTQRETTISAFDITQALVCTEA